MRFGMHLFFAEGTTKQPYKAGGKVRASDELTNTGVVMKRTSWLGTFPALDRVQPDHIADMLEEFFGVNF